MNWDWKQGDGHEHQPLLDFYVEQLMVYANLWLFKRASRRNDTMTVNRTTAIAVSASNFEVRQ